MFNNFKTLIIGLVLTQGLNAGSAHAKDFVCFASTASGAKTAAGDVLIFVKQGVELAGSAVVNGYGAINRVDHQKLNEGNYKFIGFNFNPEKAQDTASYLKDRNLFVVVDAAGYMASLGEGFMKDVKDVAELAGGRADERDEIVEDCEALGRLMFGATTAILGIKVLKGKGKIAHGGGHAGH